MKRCKMRTKGRSQPSKQTSNKQYQIWQGRQPRSGPTQSGSSCQGRREGMKINRATAARDSSQERQRRKANRRETARRRTTEAATKRTKGLQGARSTPTWQIYCRISSAEWRPRMKSSEGQTIWLIVPTLNHSSRDPSRDSTAIESHSPRMQEPH